MKDFLPEYYKTHGLPIQKFNLFGIRDESGIKQDVINDKLGFFTSDEVFICPGTTDPGAYWTTGKERNKTGTLHLLEGYHDSIWILGKHKGYDALVNDWHKCRPTKGWRDVDYNFTRDAKDIVVCDYFGANFHRMHESAIVNLIGRYSSACQAVRRPLDFEYIMQRARESRESVFSYMLFLKNEVPK